MEIVQLQAALEVGRRLAPKVWESILEDIRKNPAAKLGFGKFESMLRNYIPQ